MRLFFLYESQPLTLFPEARQTASQVRNLNGKDRQFKEEVRLMLRWTRRHVLAAAAVLATVVAVPALPAQAESVLRVIPHADLKNLDPIWTTAYISRNHGYLIYDTLFAMNEKFEPQPQMVDTYEVSDDKLTWTFKLRDGLKFHDGADVTSDDVISSLKRWGARDGMGQQLMGAMGEMVAVDASTFQFKLKEPFGLVLESIGKISSNVPFIMPKRVADTDPFKQIDDYTGSGPFVFVKEEWVPGSKVVYKKFADYKPRSEAPDAASGGKIAKVDRVEWTYFPDQTTAMNALINSEVDYFEAPANDLMPLLEANEGINVEINDPLGNIGFARFNHLLPPFDNVDVRRAAIMAMKQEDYMQGAVGRPEVLENLLLGVSVRHPRWRAMSGLRSWQPAILKRPRRPFQQPDMTARLLSSCSRQIFRFCQPSR